MITAIEGDKRLLSGGQSGPETVSVTVLDEAGVPFQLSLSHHLYLVAAMNEADTSVEPLDVAFRRRFQPLVLWPDELLLRAYLGLSATPVDLPTEAADAKIVYEAAVQAWTRVNTLITLARGPAFQLGHGVFMTPATPPDSLDDALLYASQVWALLDQHVREVFFGDVRGIATILAADQPGSPYELREELFAEAPVARLLGPAALSSPVIYTALRAIATA
jgi:5-methylcytosine-specific restriction protein B